MYEAGPRPQRASRGAQSAQPPRTLLPLLLQADVQLTQASSAAQCAAVCARVLPPVPADAQNLTVSLKKEKAEKLGGGWRNVLS